MQSKPSVYLLREGSQRGRLFGLEIKALDNNSGHYKSIPISANDQLSDHRQVPSPLTISTPTSLLVRIQPQQDMDCLLQ